MKTSTKLSPHDVITADFVVKSSKMTIFARLRPYSLMDRISDSGSDGCGSIPHGGTEKLSMTLSFFRQLKSYPKILSFNPSQSELDL